MILLESNQEKWKMERFREVSTQLSLSEGLLNSLALSDVWVTFFHRHYCEILEFRLSGVLPLTVLWISMTVFLLWLVYSHSLSCDRLQFLQVLTSAVFLNTLQQDLRWLHAIPFLSDHSSHLFHEKPSCAFSWTCSVQVDTSIATEPVLSIHCSSSVFLSAITH